MTLMEVMIASFILLMVVGGIFAALTQSRRLTEGSVAQGTALTIVAGYMEQMKNMELLQIVGGTTDTQGNLVLTPTSYAIPTLLDASTSDPIYTSTGSPPALSSITPGVTPVGVVDNLKNFVVSTGTGGSSTAQTLWRSVWPGAQNYPSSTTVGSTDLKLDIWVWVTDLSGSTTNSSKVYGITMIYTWQFMDGNRPSYTIGTVRTIRSSVPTF